MERDPYTRHFPVVLERMPEKVCVMLDPLAAKVGLNRALVSAVVGKMVQEGYIQRRRAGCYQLTTKGVRVKRSGSLDPFTPQSEPVVVRPSNDFNQSIWNVLRMAGSAAVTVREVVMVIDWPIKTPEVSARRYFANLVKTGYLIELPNKQRTPGALGFGVKRYRLIRNTGQYAPEYRPARGVMHDPNTKEDVPCASRA